MPKIFLSYRREDSIDVAGRIYDRLASKFGPDSVFMDVDSIPVGVDFRIFLSDWVGRCDVFLAVVGDSWLDAHDADGKLRLGNPNDFVTIEISAAMQRKVPVVPLLVGKAAMPKLSQLPVELSQFAYRNAAEVRSGRDFHLHMDRLVRDLERQFEAQRVKREIAEQSKSAQPCEVTQVNTIYVVIEAPAVAKPTNLSFDDAVIERMPRGWFDSVAFVSGVSTQYDVDVALRKDGVEGKCLRMHKSKAGKKEFGSLMQRCPAHKLVGKQIRVEAELRTEKLDSWAAIWVRIDGSSSHLFFDNMHDRPIKGTTPWTKYAIDVDVPMGSEWLNFGVLLSSNGTLWADNFQIGIRNELGQWDTTYQYF